MKKLIAFATLSLLATVALSKLAPPSDEAKAKSAEAAAEAAWAGKVEAWQLCKSQDKLAAKNGKAAKATGKAGKPAASSCVDPGPFVYTPAAQAAAASAAPAKKP